MELAEERGNAALVEGPALRDRTHVFRDRADAGRALARLLAGKVTPVSTMVAIPSGGVPVAIEIARAYSAPLDVGIVSKITLPWDTESGCGAVAFDGTALVDHALLSYLDLSPIALEGCIRVTREKVARRLAMFAPALGRPVPGLGDPPMVPAVAGRDAILVDDGLATGITMATAVGALRRLGPARVLVAVPTGHLEAVERICPLVDLLVCANVRGGPTFAVASAYAQWRDIEEFEALNLVTGFVLRPGGRPA